MNEKLKQVLEENEKREKDRTSLYLLLIRSAFARRAEVRKHILAEDEQMDEALKEYRRCERIIQYLINRWYRERKVYATA